MLFGGYSLLLTSTDTLLGVGSSYQRSGKAILYEGQKSLLFEMF